MIGAEKKKDCVFIKVVGFGTRLHLMATSNAGTCTCFYVQETQALAVRSAES